MKYWGCEVLVSGNSLPSEPPPFSFPFRKWPGDKSAIGGRTWRESLQEFSVLRNGRELQLNREIVAFVSLICSRISVSA